MDFYYILFGLASASAIFNIFLVLKLSRQENAAYETQLKLIKKQEQLALECGSLAVENERLKNLPSPPKTLTIEAQQLLHDLTSGTAVVKIIPISLEDIYLRSPR